jgi:3-oxoacyl-[acyl-carrier protein] reductase
MNSTHAGRLDGKVALITGSSRGIGAAIARRFASEGARVVLHGRDVAALSQIRDEIHQSGGHVTTAVADVTRFEELEVARSVIDRDLGPIDVLVANAGASITPPGPLEALSEHDWRANLDANLTGTFLTLKAFLPGMKQRRSGAIITLSSAASRRPTQRSPVAYAAAKAGIEALTQVLALQVGPFGLRANCIAPETILTERNQVQIPENIRPALIDSHPLKRLGTPDDIADAAMFLASDEASWISGVVLDVAGGSVIVR